jgi:hypothetical protein
MHDEELGGRSVLLRAAAMMFAVSTVTFDGT